MELLDKLSLFIDGHMALISSLSVVLIDVLLRVYPKGVPLLELAGKLCNGVGSLLVKLSSLFPNRKV